MSRSVLPLMIAVVFTVTLTVSGDATDSSDRRGTPWSCHTIDRSSRGADGVKLADIDGDGRLDIVTGWEEGGVTRVAFHPGDEAVRDPWPAVTVGSSPAVEDATPVDLDGDGAIDIVSSCEGRERALHVYWAPCEKSRRRQADAWARSTIPASRGARDYRRVARELTRATVRRATI